ncbi:riboflavin-specific deaminase [Gigaspora margarita]|uniref:Riboflavin-specific deaminase n=1 Tax=Gigaspora margarita TaxID=4874 RepID=A0A8H4AXP8_GIGMA|nr:riboflavin-specific deaminase [Gigaspora margarita]
MAGNFVEKEGNVFEEIAADEGEVLVENERSLLEKNDVVVLEDSEKENEIQPVSAANEAFAAHEEVKVYISQSTTPDQRRALLFNIDEPFEVSMDEFDQEWWPLVTN